MQVKRIKAKDLAQALARVKAELGEEAVILHTRQVRQPGLLGWIRPRTYEVLAAKEEGKKAAKATPPAQAKVEPKPQAQDNKEPLALLEEEYLRFGQLVAQLKDQLPQAPFSGKQLDIFESMQRAGYDLDLAQGLLQAVGEEKDLWEELRAELGGRIKTAPPLLPQEEPIVLAFIGPTGVGKTTTIAKLAARYHLKHNLKVGLATVDTYRIGAVEQLRTYAEILDLPFSVALSPGELKEALVKLREDCDVILLDTAGRSQQNKMQLGELKSFLQVAKADQVQLVLSGTASYQVNREVTANFGALEPDALIITKLDEVATVGAVASVIMESELPITYLANGQAVPDDLLLAQKEELVALSLRGIEP